MYKNHTVAAVIPAYNEAGFVGSVIEDLPEYLDRAYVIDDGSTDDTWAEIEDNADRRNAAHDGHFDALVVPIQHEANRGVGGAIKTGYARAREEEIDVTVVLGGDGQMNPQELTRYVDPIVEGTAGYAKGNRFAGPEHWERMPTFRLVGNVVLSYLTKVASGYWDVMDSQNGYAAISLEALEATDIAGMYEYYGYCNDLLVRLNVAGVRVADVPRSSEYAYSDGWKSHIQYEEYVPRVSWMLLRSFWWRLRRKYLLQQFHPLALLYLLGAGVVSVGVTGLLNALARREGDAGSWFLSTVVGILVCLRAATMDRAENEHLAVGAESAPGETREGATDEDQGRLDAAGYSTDGEGAISEARADGGLDGGPDSTEETR